MLEITELVKSFATSRGEKRRRVLEYTPRQRPMNPPRERIAGVIAPVGPRLREPGTQCSKRLGRGRIDLAL